MYLCIGTNMCVCVLWWWIKCVRDDICVKFIGLIWTKSHPIMFSLFIDVWVVQWNIACLRWCGRGFIPQIHIFCMQSLFVGNINWVPSLYIYSLFFMYYFFISINFLFSFLYSNVFSSSATFQRFVSMNV